MRLEDLYNILKKPFYSSAQKLCSELSILTDTVEVIFLSAVVWEVGCVKGVLGGRLMGSVRVGDVGCVLIVVFIIGVGVVGSVDVGDVGPVLIVVLVMSVGVVGRVLIVVLVTGVGVVGSTRTVVVGSQSPHAGRQLMLIYSGFKLHSSKRAQNSQRAFKFKHSYKDCTLQDFKSPKRRTRLFF